MKAKKKKPIEQKLTNQLEKHARSVWPGYYCSDVTVTQDKNGLVTKVEVKYSPANPGG